MSQQKYDEQEIQVKEGLEAVRAVPGMYIGNTGHRGKRHMTFEIVHNSIDEWLAGRCDHITVTLSDDRRTLRVADNGGGIPIEIHPKTKMNTVETVLTVLHAGGKFKGSKGYKNAGGLHGVGASVVNALSSHLTATIHRNGKIYQQTFEKGIRTSDLVVLGKTDKTGTIIEFTPDSTIMVDEPYDVSEMQEFLQELAYLTRPLDPKKTPCLIEFEHMGVMTRMEGKNGLSSMVDGGCNETKVMNTPLRVSSYNEKHGVQVDVSFNYIASNVEKISAFTNNIKNPEGGTHVTGFKNALTKAINKLTGQSYTGDVIRSGLVAVVSVKMDEIPEFEGQTKNKLESDSAQYAVDTVLYQYLLENLSGNSKLVKYIVKRAETNKKAIEALTAIKDIESEGKQAFAALSTKLVPATGKGKANKILILVEGDSAGGTAVDARKHIRDGIKNVAVLPLRGKIINVDRSKMSKILGNNEIRQIIRAIGAGFGDEFDVELSNYEKIIILADADPDGAHIRTLLLTMFYSYMRGLFTKGMIYVGLPPLYRVFIEGKNGQEIFCINEEDRDAALAKLGPKAETQRYKGLGEMNPSQLAATVMNPENQSLIQITVDDEVATREVMDDLMGSDTAARKGLMLEAGVWAESEEEEEVYV